MNGVVIYRHNGGWAMMLGNRRIVARKLMSLIRVAELLQVHVDNKHLLMPAQRQLVAA